MEDLAKKTQLRNNEYYCTQEVFDELYKRSARGDNFYDLVKLIEKDVNMRLAYRNIKTNDGSKTNGLSGKNMSYIANMCLSRFLNETKNQIENYKPSLIKRIGIPKSNGKIRYLGIKEPQDKIIEQAIYQILEPILTAKFHNNSNGFIKGRNTRRAIAQFTNYIVRDKLYYVIDLDIKSFFDNVNHGKLLKQLWSCGVRDKNLLTLISKMLKAEVFKVGIPEKGTPQGGILSPLLANLVLNELDWWLESKTSKGIRFVRYADDVKILCPTYLIARDMLEKTTKWLKERLELEVCEEKTQIINLKRNYSNFLGIKLKVKSHKGKYKIVSHMTDKAQENIKKKIKKQIRQIKKTNNNEKKFNQEIEKYNSLSRGVHNYYNMATKVYEDLLNIHRSTRRYFEEKLNCEYTFQKGSKKKIPLIRGKPVIIIGEVESDPPRYAENKINYFEANSRRLFHKELEIENIFMLDIILKNPWYHESVEFNDVVLSRFCGQLGKYAITNEPIYNIRNLKPIKIKFNGNDKYDNIILVESRIENLIKLKEVDDIIKISNLIKGVKLKEIEKINKIRKENSLLLI